VDLCCVFVTGGPRVQLLGIQNIQHTRQEKKFNGKITYLIFFYKKKIKYIFWYSFFKFLDSKPLNFYLNCFTCMYICQIYIHILHYFAKILGIQVNAHE
jgi:hypothetical protein